ncbi:MAG: YiiX/YebB-like N1pC/P60 family cysteine hydrolase [bacterium]|jgi:uncharacterized protein YycO
MAIQNLLKDGLLLFVKECNHLADIVGREDKNCPYTHVGIIYNKGVIHSHTDKKAQGAVKYEDIKTFMDGIDIYGLYKPLVDYTIMKKASLKAVSYIGRPFDGSFTLINDDAVYCTELIWRSYLFAGVDLVESRIKTINFMRARQIILPSSILKSKYLVKKEIRKCIIPFN